jgi:hypothetical protein
LDSISLNRECFSNPIDERVRQKHSEPIETTFRGIVIETNARLPKNAQGSILFSLQFASNEIDDNEPGKHQDPMTETFCGIMIDSNEELKKAFDSMRFSLEFSPKTTDESEVQQAKHERSNTSISHGMTIAESDPKYRIKVAMSDVKTKSSWIVKNGLFSSIEIDILCKSEKAAPSMNDTFAGIVTCLKPDQEKAFDSILFNFESFSKERDTSDWHHEKHSAPRISTFAGTTIDDNDELKKTYGSILMSCDPSSNDTRVKNLQQAKQESLKNSILFGIRINPSSPK